MIAGCRSRNVTAAISLGPVGPAELPPDKVKLVTDYLPNLGDASSSLLELNLENTVPWPLEIRFSPGGTFSKVAIYPHGFRIVDGRPYAERAGNSQSLSKLIEPEYQRMISDISFLKVFAKCDGVKLTLTDEPELELSLDSDRQRDIGSLLQGLSMRDPDGGDAIPPYPGYVLILEWNGVSVPAELTGREYITLRTGGAGFSGLTWHDPDGRVWEYCLSLLPPPPFEQRTGLNKLFASTADVRASGGDLGQPVICWGERTPSLVRLLKKGQASPDNAPAGDPVAVAFSDAENEWTVYLYENGFLFEEQYYRLKDIKKTFLTTMNAG